MAATLERDPAILSPGRKRPAFPATPAGIKPRTAAQIAVFVNFVLVVVGGEELVLTEDHIKKSFANRGGDVDYDEKFP